jgi:hypothetical protein
MSGQALVHLERDDLLPGRPLEDVLEPPDPVVNEPPGEVGLHHPLADDLQRERPELGHGSMHVEFPHEPDQDPVLHHLVRRCAVRPAGVPVRVPHECEQHLVDGQVAPGGAGRPTGHELGEEPLVLGVGLRGVPPAECAGAADAVLVHVEDGAALVVLGDGDGGAGARHSDNPRNAGGPAIPRFSWPRSRPPGGKLNCFG